MAASFGQTDGDLAGMISQMGGYITKAVNDRMEQAMTEVQRETIARAPVDHGNLEDAVKLERSDYRRSWIVYVDGSMPGGDNNLVGDYAPRMHEDFSYHLGPKSLAKGGKVGPKFLENPFREIVTQALLDELKATIEQAIANRRRR